MKWKVHKKLSKRKVFFSNHQPIYLRAFAITLLFTFATLFVFLYNDFSSYRYFRQTVLPKSSLSEIVGNIALFDEVLAMSARMCVATGDLQWEERYRTFKPQLDTTIQIAKRVAPEIFITNAAFQIEQANIALIEMEYRSFELVHNGNLSAAQALLDSPEYKTKRQAYAIGFKQLIASMEKHDKKLLSSENQKLFLAMLSAFVMMLLLLIAWIIVLRATQKHEKERKQSERKIRASERRFKSIIEQSPIAIALLDLQGHPIVSNAALSRMVGYSCDELSKMTFADFTFPEDAEKDMSQFMALLEGKISDYSMEKRYIHKNGNIVWGNLFVTIRCDSKGNLIEIIGMAEDITKRKKAEQALKESETRYSTIFEQSPIGMQFYRRDGLLLKVNTSCLDIFGITDPEEIKNWNLFNDPNVTVELKEKLHQGESIKYLVEFDFEIVKKLNLYNTNKSGTRVFDVQISALEIGFIAQIQDVSERILAELSLKESEERYRLLVDNMPIGMIVSQEDNIVFANTVITQILKAPDKSKLLGKFIYEFIPDDYIDKTKERRKNLTEFAPLADPEEFKIINFDKTLVDVEIRAVRILFNGRPAILNLISDITERRKSEQDLLESEAGYRELSDMLPQAVFESNIEGKLTYINKIAYSLFNITKEDFDKGIYAIDMIVPEERDFALNRIQLIYESKEPKSHEYSALRKEGTKFPAVFSTNVIIRDNKIIGLRGTVFNITDRKKAELAIIKSEERLQQLLSSVTDYIYSVKIENGIATETKHGEGCKTITGYSQNEFKADPYLWLNIIYDNDKDIIQKQIHELLNGHDIAPIEHRIYHKNGNVKWVLNTSVAHLSPEGILLGYDGLISDITQRKMLENQILNSVIETEERERSRFAMELHDGLGPLFSTIKLYVQSIQDEKNPNERKSVLKIIHSSVNEAITSLREISNNISPHILQNFGLISAVNSFIEKIKYSKKVNIIFNTNTNLRFHKNIEISIYRVLIELINNTLKYAGAKTITIDITLNENILNITYIDDGKGADLNNISHKKSGMGIFNIQNRIKSLNGQIKIDSLKKQGLKADIYIDLTEQEHLNVNL